jgi:molybdopterin-binding protein
MKLSARNQMAGTIKAVTPGATTTHVTIEVSPSVRIAQADHGGTGQASTRAA